MAHDPDGKSSALSLSALGSKTPEEIPAHMVEAGLDVLHGSGAVEIPLDADRLLVAEIFLAMVGRAASHACPVGPADSGNRRLAPASFPMSW